MANKEYIRGLLQKLLEEALKEKKWFYLEYQDLYFSPREISDEWDHGRFIWGPANWELVYPPKYEDLYNERGDIDREELLQLRILNGWEVL